MRETVIRKNPAHASVRALVKSILPTLKWRHHGIGVLQGYVAENEDPEVRVHIWSRDLVKVGICDNGDAHNHRFDMISHVITGRIVHEELDIQPSTDGDFTTMSVTHARVAAETAFHGQTEPTAMRYTVRRNIATIDAGNYYTFPAGLFHRNIVPDVTTITCVEKHGQREDIKAEVMHRVGADPVMAFGHEPDHSLMLKVIQSAIASLCDHPRERWYGDREHGTTFCGICHHDITSTEAVLSAQKRSKR